MDVAAVRDGIVTVIGASVASLSGKGRPYAVDDGTPTLFYVASVLPVFDEAMNRGLDRMTAVVRLLVEGPDEISAQRRLDAYLAGSGAESVKAALVAGKTLNGSCRSSRAVGWDNYRRHPLGSSEYYGADLTIDIYGGN